MSTSAEEIARRAASRLSPEFGAGFPALVERQLRQPGVEVPRYTGVETAIALATLLVSIAQFAWQIYRDLRKDKMDASPEAMARQLRLKIELPPQVTAEQRGRLVTVVVEEVLAKPRS